PAKAEKPATDSMLGKQAGDARNDNGLKMKLVWCPPGVFPMGQEPVVKPVKVVLTRGYWLGKYEVTQPEWRSVMETQPWQGMRNVKEGDDFPATSMLWDEAMEFCRKLTDRERQLGRLPKEWEYTLPTDAQWE